MTIWIYQELLLLNFNLFDISWASIIHPSQKLRPFEFAESFFVQFCTYQFIIGLSWTIRVKCFHHLNFVRASVVQFWASQYMMSLNHISESKFKAVWIFLVLPCLIASVSIYYWLKSDIRVKSYGRLSLTCVSMFNFARLDILWDWIENPSQKICCSIWISQELLLFNFKRLDISKASIIHPSQKLWQFKFSESFLVQFCAYQYIIGLN